jgi:hypothetical protein
MRRAFHKDYFGFSSPCIPTRPCRAALVQLDLRQVRKITFDHFKHRIFTEWAPTGARHLQFSFSLEFLLTRSKTNGSSSSSIGFSGCAQSPSQQCITPKPPHISQEIIRQPM